MSPRDPVTLTLPAFRGAVKRLVLALLAVYVGLALLSLVAPQVAFFLFNALCLTPLDVAHGQVWRLATYAFLNGGILGTAFALLNLWFVGSMLEDARGARWFTELFYVSVTGGAVLTTLLASVTLLTHGAVHVPHVDPASAVSGVGAPLFGVLVAFAMFFGDTEFLLFFVLRAKAKYVVIIGGLIYVVTVLRDGNALYAMLALMCGLSGYLYVKFAHRTGMTASISERMYGLQNGYVRWKRRRAARKFEVYMRKQDRVVKFDENGRYIAPEDEAKNPRDKKWMN